MHRLTWRSDHPLDFAAATARYTRWGVDPVNRVIDGALYRVIEGPSGPISYRAHQRADGTVMVEADGPDEAAAALEDVRYRLAEHLPYPPLRDLVDSDPIIGAAQERHPGYRPPMNPDPFESIVTSITAQQVNLSWATTTLARLVHSFGAPIEWQGIELWAFPTPEALAAASPAQLRDLQFTWSKSEYIVGVAQAATEGRLLGLDAMDDATVISAVTELRGVGRWTAEWLLARCLGRPAAVAAGDLGVQKAVGHYYLALGRKATEGEVRSVATAWGDAANWAAHLLLEELAGAERPAK